MCWTSLRRVLMTCCAAAALLSTPTRSWAACALWDWMFGSGQTTYAPPYCPPNISTATAPACGCAPAQPACGCAAVQPACQPCVPTATYRISYRPVPTVAYMPVVSIDPCSGCAVTTYRPTQTWTYRASLVPYPTYQVGYAPVAVGGCGSCGGCAPCSGYSSSYGGCSSCATGVSGGYVSSGGCSSCATPSAPLTSTLLPGPGDMSGPPATYSPSTAASAPTTSGSPGAMQAAPGTSSGSPHTYAPNTPAPPISPSAPGAGASPSGTSYRVPASSEDNHTAEPPKIQGIPPLPSSPSGPRLAPPPLPRPENEKTTSRPVQQAMYFQLLPSPPASVPAQLISAPVPAAPEQVDIGWRHAGN